MKYKMIAIDMDGTLLNDNKEVSEVNKIAIGKAADLGVKVVVCTGRIFTSAKVYASLIGTPAPIIASNGAYIREKDRDEIIYRKNMDSRSLHGLVRLIESYGFFPHLFTSDSIYTKEIIHLSMSYYKWNQTLPEDERVNIQLVKDFDEIIDKNEILKVNFVSDSSEKLLELRDRISRNYRVSMMASAVNNLEIMSEGISKANGVRILADYFGFNPSEIICIGDNENDISMIEYAGLGVAMGNATEELKRVADFITDTNENDGVAKVINKFVL